jgi:hypothetical protein
VLLIGFNQTEGLTTLIKNYFTDGEQINYSVVGVWVIKIRPEPTK